MLKRISYDDLLMFLPLKLVVSPYFAFVQFVLVTLCDTIMSYNRSTPRAMERALSNEWLHAVLRSDSFRSCETGRAFAHTAVCRLLRRCQDSMRFVAASLDATYSNNMKVKKQLSPF
jgi:hypothetical protein